LGVLYRTTGANGSTNLYKLLCGKNCIYPSDLTATVLVRRTQMERSKVYYGTALLYVCFMVCIAVVWVLSLVGTLIGSGTVWGLWLVYTTVILAHTVRKSPAQLHDLLVITPALYLKARRVFAPGHYNYKIEEHDHYGSRSYIVLIRPEGSTGFTFTKEAYVVENYSFSDEDQLFELSATSKEAAAAVYKRIETEAKEIASKQDSWKRRLTRLEDVAELITS
jgi:hypothetical protein